MTSFNIVPLLPLPPQNAAPPNATKSWRPLACQLWHCCHCTPAHQSVASHRRRSSPARSVPNMCSNPNISPQRQQQVSSPSLPNSSLALYVCISLHILAISYYMHRCIHFTTLAQHPKPEFGQHLLNSFLQYSCNWHWAVIAQSSDSIHQSLPTFQIIISQYYIWHRVYMAYIS